jgi:hypothetical protein
MPPAGRTGSGRLRAWFQTSTRQTSAPSDTRTAGVRATAEPLLDRGLAVVVGVFNRWLRAPSCERVNALSVNPDRRPAHLCAI